MAWRLLTTDADNGAVVIGVAHEAFLSAWPPLAEAIAPPARTTPEQLRQPGTCRGVRARRAHTRHQRLVRPHHAVGCGGPGPAPPLTDLPIQVRVVAFSPDGRTLVTGGDDGTAILWDLTDPVQPQRLGPPLAGHSREVLSVAFSPGGRTLAAGSTDGTATHFHLRGSSQLPVAL